MATPDMDEAKASIRSLAERDVDRVHCYHGWPIDAGPEEMRALAGGGSEVRTPDRGRAGRDS